MTRERGREHLWRILVVGGSQVSHSRSFMLVTNVSNVNQPISKNSTVTLKPGLAAR